MVAIWVSKKSKVIKEYKYIVLICNLQLKSMYIYSKITSGSNSVDHFY